MKNQIHMLKSVNNGQMNSFILTTSEGGVILIDGGWEQNVPYTLDYLRELTGEAIPHIDAIWLSHPHSDHINAFMEMIKNHSSEFTFDAVYYNFTSEQFMSYDTEARGTLSDFNKLTPMFADKIRIVSGYDEYDIRGAHFEVLYSPDYEITANVCNNTSVVIRVTLGGKSIMFTGDCGIEAGEKILRLSHDKLKSDYCQMAHHGQNGVNRDFYAAVAPTACLWCTPDWLWNNDVGKGFNTHIWKTVEVRGWMDELGVRENYVMMNGTQVIEL